jgi:hypothetical protein
VQRVRRQGTARLGKKNASAGRENAFLTRFPSTSRHPTPGSSPGICFARNALLSSPSGTGSRASRRVPSACLCAPSWSAHRTRRPGAGLRLRPATCRLASIADGRAASKAWSRGTSGLPGIPDRRHMGTSGAPLKPVRKPEAELDPAIVALRRQSNAGACSNVAIRQRIALIAAERNLSLRKRRRS